MPRSLQWWWFGVFCFLTPIAVTLIVIATAPLQIVIAGTAALICVWQAWVAWKGLHG